MMGGVRRFVMLAAACAAAVVVAGCGSGEPASGKVEAQLEKQLKGEPEFVECDRSSDQRYTCRVETSSDRFRYVATCPSPGQPCVMRRTGAEFK
jgi:hypothetical protein